MVGATIGLMGSAQARSLDTIRSIGALGLCAHPNSLPFASKAGDPPGFQVEMGQALARELGVSLKLDWIITVYQIRSADCDIVMDVIADREAQSETNLRISKPYYRTGVALAVPLASKLTSFKSLDEHTKVGVQVGSCRGDDHQSASRANVDLRFRSRQPRSAGQSRDRRGSGHADRCQLFQSDASGQGASASWISTRARRTSTGMSPLAWSARTRGCARPSTAALERLRADGTVDRRLPALRCRAAIAEIAFRPALEKIIDLFSIVPWCGSRGQSIGIFWRGASARHVGWGRGSRRCRRGWWRAVHSQAHAQSLRRGAVRRMGGARTSNTSVAMWCSATRRPSIVRR